MIRKKLKIKKNLKALHQIGVVLRVPRESSKVGREIKALNSEDILLYRLLPTLIIFSFSKKQLGLMNSLSGPKIVIASVSKITVSFICSIINKAKELWLLRLGKIFRSLSPKLLSPAPSF